VRDNFKLLNTGCLVVISVTAGTAVQLWCWSGFITPVNTVVRSRGWSNVLRFARPFGDQEVE